MRIRLAIFVLALLMMMAVLPTLAQDAAPEASGALTLEPLGTVTTGAFDEGAQEIVAYHAPSQTVYAVNAQAVTLDLISIADPAAPTVTTQVDMTQYGDSANSVAVYGDLVAVAIQAEAADANGSVVFLNPAGEFISTVEVGVLPDMVTFSPDGTKVLTANEGEPNDDYSVDAEGSVSIIDVSGGVEAATVTTVGFTDFNTDGARAAELPEGARIFGPNATVAQDLEPEYIAVSPDSSTAYVTLQEANVYAVIDINAGSVTAIYSFGVKDHSLPGNALDAGNDDGVINIANWPVFGLYQPDGIAAYEVDGTIYVVTANEGDTRDYETYSEEGELGESAVDEAFPDLETLVTEGAIGGLEILESIGDTDGDGDLDQLYIPGGRSFSIYNANTGEQVFDSGDQLEQIIAAAFPENFNASHDDNGLDDRSDNKGPEPEGVTLAVIGESTYAFIGLERQSGIMVYDVTDPTAPVFVTYVENRSYDADPGTPEAGDLGPEGLLFISAEESPNGQPLLVVANEVSGTTTIWQITVN
ncbi:MAG: choice-of-anchor I family protein [bacterium]|nr:choice-of-anchor I family protein [bacterium]